MEKIRLTTSQSLKLFHGEEVKITRNGKVMYIHDEGDKLVALDWLGKTWEDVEIISDFD